MHTFSTELDEKKHLENVYYILFKLLHFIQIITWIITG